MRYSRRTNWSLGLGAMGALLVAGLMTISAARPATAAPVGGADDASRGAQQTPSPTPGGNQLAAGRQRFDHACGRCHPGGEEDIGPRLRNINWAEDRMLRQIRNGGGRMRPIPPARLPDSEIPALMAYMRTLHAVR
jgi:mono/diheme cytochrome c family protein